MTQPTLAVWPPNADADAMRFLTRRFGDAREDLDIDFSGRPRAVLVTALLGLCLRTPDRQCLDTETLWQWTVAERLQGLLAIACATTGDVSTAVAACSNTDCGEQIEIDLGLGSFAVTSPSAIEWQATGGERVHLRLPAGLDQHAWYIHAQQTQTIDEQWFARRLVTRVDDASPAPGWTVPTVWLEPLGASLDAADPLTALAVEVSCPSCGKQLRVDVDLEDLLLEGLRERQRTQLDDVHRLARAYHWSETDIVALPAWRRARYLSRISAEAL